MPAPSTEPRPSGSGHLDAADAALIQIVDAGLAEAARRSGPWLVCRPGCTECCLGPFSINQLDARRLRQGLAALDISDRDRATRVRDRARAYVGQAVPPADAETDDEPCPALDPATGCCDLYAARPLTCRTFGPPVRCGSDAVGVCELCFSGATDVEIAACEVEIDPQGLESELLAELETAIGVQEMTTVALALAS
jgi:Fe-S-cluster containining protein